jgi:hypothetical protein
LFRYQSACAQLTVLTRFVTGLAVDVCFAKQQTLAESRSEACEASHATASRPTRDAFCRSWHVSHLPDHSISPPHVPQRRLGVSFYVRHSSAHPPQFQDQKRLLARTPRLLSTAAAPVQRHRLCQSFIRFAPGRLTHARHHGSRSHVIILMVAATCPRAYVMSFLASHSTTT